MSLDRGPRGPQEAEKRFVFVFYVEGPGPLRWRAGAHLPRDQKRSALRWIICGLTNPRQHMTLDIATERRIGEVAALLTQRAASAMSSA